MVVEPLTNTSEVVVLLLARFLGLYFLLVYSYFLNLDEHPYRKKSGLSPAAQKKFIGRCECRLIFIANAVSTSEASFSISMIKLGLNHRCTHIYLSQMS